MYEYIGTVFENHEQNAEPVILVMLEFSNFMSLIVSLLIEG